MLTNRIERFREVGDIFLCNQNGESVRTTRVENAWLQQGRAVLKLAGVDSMSEAELLRGLDVCIPRERRRQPEPGEILFSDLLDCQVFDEDGRLLGVFTEWYEAGEQVWLRLDPGERLIPFVKEYFVDLDFAAKRIRVRLPEGLLDLDQA